MTEKAGKALDRIITSPVAESKPLVLFGSDYDHGGKVPLAGLIGQLQLITQVGRGSVVCNPLA